jgi:hypothetical protein
MILGLSDAYLMMRRDAVFAHLKVVSIGIVGKLSNDFVFSMNFNNAPLYENANTAAGTDNN